MKRLISPLVLTGLLILTAGTARADQAQPSAALPGNDAFRRGWNFEQGIGSPINIPEAIRAYDQAANAGNVMAKARLSRIYFGGNGVVVDHVKAEQYAKGIFPDLLKVAEANDPIAQNDVGIMYIDGIGVARDSTEGAKWVSKAALQKLPLAEANLGVIYEHGEGVPMDIGQAVAWANQAALQGSPMGQAYLGDFYNEGRGVPKNQFEAARLYGLSAAQNFAHAETNLGYMYDHGCVVGLNNCEAARLYRLAADQNFAVAQTNLAECYRYGSGVPCDVNAAVYWYQRAAAQGDQNAIEALRCLGYAY